MNNSGMLYNGTVEQGQTIGDSSDLFSMHAGPYTSSSTPFSNVNACRRPMVRIHCQGEVSILPTPPPPSSLAPLQFELRPETFTRLLSILQKTIPVYLNGGKDIQNDE